MSGVVWRNAIDFLVLALGIYLLLRWSREARALRLALGILALHVGALLARQLGLLLTGWVLDAATIVVILALVVVFQPELRRALTRFDLRGRAKHESQTSVGSAVSAAAFSLAAQRCGALVVLVGKDSVDELVTPGVPLGGRVSPEILEALFQKGSPVHDGAAIIDGDAIARVGAILPLTQRAEVPEGFGTRHRAGMGLAERSDAVVIVVSEESGEVTMMNRTRIRPMSSTSQLAAALSPGATSPVDGSLGSRRTGRLMDIRLAATALALSAMVWGVTFLLPGASVRVRSIPLEFTHVPAGLTVASQSAETIAVWLRGSDFIFDSVNLDALVARCDLEAAHEGVNAVPIRADTLELPLGLQVERISPRQVSVGLVK